MSHISENSQTAQDFINDQLQLEADAREALPYAFDTCTRPLGALRQIVFSCLTCNPPPPTDSSVPYNPAGVCYSCSISCHGEHELVELFNKRNFVCDCGTTRITNNNPCTLRISEKTGLKGDVKGETPAANNRYNHNFANRFCGCGEVYDAHQERGTMFQCLGLGNEEDGGCGEDWWHPECLVGLPRRWYEQEEHQKPATNGADKVHIKADPAETSLPTISEDEAPTNRTNTVGESDEAPLPPGFPEEDSFEHMICYKCVESNPWIKSYAGAPGFLPALPYRPDTQTTSRDSNGQTATPGAPEANVVQSTESSLLASTSLKRKAEDDVVSDSETKKTRSQFSTPFEAELDVAGPGNCKLNALPAAPTGGRFSLFLTEGFREHLCRCPNCFPRLAKYPHLLEEEETYEPPLSSVAGSENGDQAAAGGGGSVGSKSLLDRGEAALSNMDRVRAIEGVMAYNHLKEGLKGFLKPFAEEGRVVDAESIKVFFEKLRGDSEGIRSAAAGASTGGGDGEDKRREQGGY